MPYSVIDPALAQAAPTTTLGAPLPPAVPPVGLALVDLRSQLDMQLGGRTDFDPAIFDQWINQAYIDLATSLELPELKGSLAITLTASQSLYLLPGVIRAIRMVSVIDTVTYGTRGGIKLNKGTLEAYRRSSDRADPPQEYFVENGILVLYPSPAAVRTIAIDFWIRPLDLVNEDDYPILPKEWHEAILRNARAKAHSDLREFERAAITNNELVGLVRRKTDPDSLEDDDRIVGSSVPRTRSALSRRNIRSSDLDRD